MEGWRLGSIWLEEEDKREGGGIKRVEAEGREGLRWESLAGLGNRRPTGLSHCDGDEGRLREAGEGGGGHVIQGHIALPGVFHGMPLRGLK